MDMQCCMLMMTNMDARLNPSPVPGHFPHDATASLCGFPARDQGVPSLQWALGGGDYDVADDGREQEVSGGVGGSEAAC